MENNIIRENNDNLDDKFDDPIYLLFKKWYIESVNNYFLHSMANTYNSIFNSIFNISIIILSALATLLSGIIIILNELDIYIAVLVLTLLILFINFIIFILSAINKFINFSKLSRKHKNSSNQFKELAEDILILFTPLSPEEIEINLANERNFIHKKITFFKDVSPSIPQIVKMCFKRTKRKNKYLKYIKLFESIKIENNELFNPIYNNVLNDNIQINNNVLLNDNNNNNINTPLLQQMYDEQKIY